MTTCSIMGIPQEAGQIKRIAPEFANTPAERTQINLSQEQPVTQEIRVWKRERKKFILGADSEGRWQFQALATESLDPQDGYLESYRERLGWVRERE